MIKTGRIVTMWVGRREAHLTVDGAGEPELAARLQRVVDRLLIAGVAHLVVDLHRLRGNDTVVLEILAVACRRLWTNGGVTEVDGLRDRLVSRPEVQAYPELFGQTA